MPAECAAVVKGDAYGCGLEQVTATLSRAGCKTFFVAHLDEARRVRRLAPEAAIYVLNGFAAGAGPAFAEAYARPVINSLGRARRMGRSSSPRAAGAAASALHVDTGMNRLGLSIDEAAAVAHAHADGKSRHHAADEPLRLRRPAAASAQRPADPAVPRNPHAVPRHSRLARQFLRHLPRISRPIATWCARASRSTASIRRRASPIR